jgi:hypothetical protein
MADTSSYSCISGSGLGLYFNIPAVYLCQGEGHGNTNKFTADLALKNGPVTQKSVRTPHYCIVIY